MCIFLRSSSSEKKLIGFHFTNESRKKTNFFHSIDLALNTKCTYRSRYDFFSRKSSVLTTTHAFPLLFCFSIFPLCSKSLAIFMQFPPSDLPRPCRRKVVHRCIFILIGICTFPQTLSIYAKYAQRLLQRSIVTITTALMRKQPICVMTFDRHRFRSIAVFSTSDLLVLISSDFDPLSSSFSLQHPDGSNLLFGD